MEQQTTKWRTGIFIFKSKGYHQEAGTNLSGEAGGEAASHGLAGDVASEHRVDRIEEAGLSSSNWSNEQDPSLGHRAVCGLVDLNTLL